jgi:predicted Co/Zn/Cd cation transporter (cation efflux family)
MPDRSDPRQRRGLMAIDGAMALMVVLLIVQVWLLSAALDAYLAGYREAALPAAIVSGILFLVCLGLFLMIDNLDRRVRRQ